MTGKSNRSVMDRLMDDFVEALREKVKPDAEGKPPAVEAATLNVIRQFLKDQNVSVDPEAHEGLGNLAKETRKLPFDEKPGERDAS